LRQPLNHRNEAAAVSLLIQKMPFINKNGREKVEERENPCDALKAKLSEHCEHVWPLFSAAGRSNKEGAYQASNGSDDKNAATALPSRRSQPQQPTFPGSDTPSGAFHTWSDEQGIISNIKIASFGDLRGCAATTTISPGKNILSIPKEALIYDETVLQTDLGRMLSTIPDLSIDNLLIIFTLCDRFDSESRWAPFWRSLPEFYFTGLSFPPHVLSSLHGSAAHLEILRGQIHLHKQYAATRPILEILLQAYPQYLEQEWFIYERYMWAAELFYSYAFEIEFPPNPQSKTVMVPFACHVNHSPWPHVVRYGRINPGTNTLDYPAFRPCTKGEQVFISYGPVPNMKLISYYGFAIEDNPHDLVPMQLDGGELRKDQKDALKKFDIGMEHSLRDGPFAPKLLACLRLVVATENEVKEVLKGKKNPLLAFSLGDACERQALNTLEVALQGLLEPVEKGLDKFNERSNEQKKDILGAVNGGIGALDGGEGSEKSSEKNENGFDTDWKASLEFCRVYMEGQKVIIQRAIEECEKLKERIGGGGGEGSAF
jgi:SET domain